MKKKTNEWHIDDTVYFLEETSHNGDFPNIMKGTIEEIKRDCVRVKIKGTGWENLVWVDSDRVFQFGGMLLNKLEKHLADEIAKINELYA